MLRGPGGGWPMGTIKYKNATLKEYIAGVYSGRLEEYVDTVEILKVYS